MLDVLKAEGVQATFFVVGRRVEQHREIVCRIVADGHALGHHTYTHGDPTRVSARELAAEVRETRRLLDQIVGQSSSLFRPPHGKLTPGKLWRLWLAGQTVVLWNVDPKDFARSSADELRMWFRDNPVRGGDIVLLHDNKPHAAAALPELIAGARRQGLTFGTALQWIA